MSPTPEDVQAKIDSAVAALKKTTSGYVKSPGGVNWVTGFDLLAQARAEAGLLLAPPVNPPPPPPPPSGTDVDAPQGLTLGALLFHEEFDGTVIDTKKWEGKGFTAPSGTHWNKLANSRLDGNGNLVIKAKKINGIWVSDFLAGLAANGFSYKGPRYTCAMAKLPVGVGCFPAPCWEWAAPWGAGPIEVDVCEQLGSKEPHVYHTTVHSWLPSGDYKPSFPNDVGVDLTADFHIYGAAVHASKIDFYFDNKFIRSIDMSGHGLNDLTTYSVVPCIDLDMGGWAGAIGSDVVEPEMFVKYFRSYSLAN